MNGKTVTLLILVALMGSEVVANEARRERLIETEEEGGDSDDHEARTPTAISGTMEERTPSWLRKRS